jgi:HSP20 family protein
MKSVTALTKVPHVTTLLADDPFLTDIQALHEAISRRAYELFEQGGSLLGRDLEDWFRAESEFLQPSRLEVTEDDDEFRVRAEVLGLTEKDIEVKVDPQRVYITGKHEESSETKKGKNVHSERSSKRVLHEYYLPAEIDPDGVTAELKSDVLEVALPKRSKSTQVKETKAA